MTPTLTRNKRSVWHVATHPYSDAHFATFPEKLIEPCILAGSRPGDLVFDPFIGSGTVGAVSERLMRRWVGTDLSYQHLAKKRTRQRGLKFVEATA
jgi:site-specific DNA-methyltransferase (cytosine-N4-specific)